MRILSISDLHGNKEVLPKLLKLTQNTKFDILVFAGDVLKWKAKCAEWAEAKAQKREPQRDREDIKQEIRENLQYYHIFYDYLRMIGLPSFVIPGNLDAPFGQYMRVCLCESAVGKNQNLIHQTFMPFDDFVIAGFGGEVTEDQREDYFVLQFPRWEVEHGLSFVKHLQKPKIFLLHTPPTGELDLDEGDHKGSKVINDLIEEFKPEWVFCGHAHNARGKQIIGDSIVVNPGALKNNYYAVVDTETKEVELKSL